MKPLVSVLLTRTNLPVFWWIDDTSLSSVYQCMDQTTYRDTFFTLQPAWHTALFFRRVNNQATSVPSFDFTHAKRIWLLHPVAFRLPTTCIPWQHRLLFDRRFGEAPSYRGVPEQLTEAWNVGKPRLRDQQSVEAEPTHYQLHNDSHYTFDLFQAKHMRCFAWLKRAKSKTEN